MQLDLIQVSGIDDCVTARLLLHFLVIENRGILPSYSRVDCLQEQTRQSPPKNESTQTDIRAHSLSSNGSWRLESILHPELDD